MTVTELREELERMERRGCGDDEVRVITADPSVAYTSSVPIDFVFSGFDWDKGKTFVRPAKKLTRKGDAE